MACCLLSITPLPSHLCAQFQASVTQDVPRARARPYRAVLLVQGSQGSVHSRIVELPRDLVGDHSWRSPRGPNRALVRAGRGTQSVELRRKSLLAGRSRGSEMPAFTALIHAANLTIEAGIGFSTTLSPRPSRQPGARSLQSKRQTVCETKLGGGVMVGGLPGRAPSWFRKRGSFRARGILSRRHLSIPEQLVTEVVRHDHGHLSHSDVPHSWGETCWRQKHGSRWRSWREGPDRHCPPTVSSPKQANGQSGLRVLRLCPTVTEIHTRPSSYQGALGQLDSLVGC